MGATDAVMLELADAELIEKLKDPVWRLTSGHLYKIIIKDETDPAAEGLVLPFKPNRAQRRFISRLHHRNIILKARQLGFTTLVAILWLDFALFNSNVRCGIIAQDDGTAQIIFRDKVKFAYDNLPEFLKEMMPLKFDNAHELVFAHNNSSIRVATSMRGGTIHRLHISEFGKICAKFPAKADEVITGSIPAVPATGVLIIESTAEGQQGAFYEMTQAAIKLLQLGKKLTVKDFRFHFFAWFQDEQYRMDTSSVFISDKDHSYFNKLEADMNITIDPEQRAWYVATRNDFESSGKGEKMQQEYPSTPEESFQQSMEGTYYGNQMTAMRKQGRICKVPILEIPVNTFWDIGNSDGTAIWLHQQVGLEHRFIGYYEEHGEHLTHYFKYLQDLGYLWNKHFLPHDADHARLSSDQNKSIKEQLEDLGMQNIEIVPRITDLTAGIQIVRKHFPSAYIEQDKCAKGIKRLDGYKRKWNTTHARFINEPEKNDGNSEGADAFRQWAQALELNMLTNNNATSSMGNRPATPWQTN
ncbi:MAG: terminase [Methylotenera sp.]|nr:MAG: terminase [Methylotenera sp.]